MEQKPLTGSDLQRSIQKYKEELLRTYKRKILPDTEEISQEDAAPFAAAVPMTTTAVLEAPPVPMPDNEPQTKPMPVVMHYDADDVPSPSGLRPLGPGDEEAEDGRESAEAAVIAGQAVSSLLRPDDLPDNGVAEAAQPFDGTVNDEDITSNAVTIEYSDMSVDADAFEEDATPSMFRPLELSDEALEVTAESAAEAVTAIDASTLEEDDAPSVFWPRESPDEAEEDVAGPVDEVTVSVNSDAFEEDAAPSMFRPRELPDEATEDVAGLIDEVTVPVNAEAFEEDAVPSMFWPHDLPDEAVEETAVPVPETTTLENPAVSDTAAAIAHADAEPGEAAIFDEDAAPSMFWPHDLPEEAADQVADEPADERQPPIKVPRFLSVSEISRDGVSHSPDDDDDISPSGLMPGFPARGIGLDADDGAGFMDDSDPDPSKPPVLQVHVTTARQSLPVPGAHVVVTGNDTSHEDDSREDAIILHKMASTDESGNTPEMTLPVGEAPDGYTVEVSSPGFCRARHIHVPLYNGLKSIQAVDLIPLPEGSDISREMPYDQSLFNG